MTGIIRQVPSEYASDAAHPGRTFLNLSPTSNIISPKCLLLTRTGAYPVNKLGKYELIQELGRGAMGIVYRARDPIINRLVALKTITKGVAEDPNMLQRFYREAQSAGGLQHPNIVTIYDMGEEVRHALHCDGVGGG